MSMLSAQCDELRERARVLGNLTPWFDNSVDADLMKQAADTIWELRNKLCDMVDERERARVLERENAKLSTQLTDVTESMGRVEERCAKLREELEDQEGYDQMLRDRLRQQTELCVKAEAENAKLRELVRIMHSELVSCEDNGYVCGGHKFDGRVRELGVEVDG